MNIIVVWVGCMAKAKKSKDEWMEFYNGKIPKKLTKKKVAKKKAKPDVHECFYCSNKSNEGDGAFVDDLVSSEPSKKFWVCAPCISKHVSPSNVLAQTTVDDDDDDDNSIETLTPLEIMQMEKRQKDKNFWLVIFGVIAIAIILSLVERSRIFSVIAVVALVFVFLLYKYEVRI